MAWCHQRRFRWPLKHGRRVLAIPLRAPDILASRAIGDNDAADCGLLTKYVAGTAYGSVANSRRGEFPDGHSPGAVKSMPQCRRHTLRIDPAVCLRVE
jgi:hypothetical protein